MFKLTIILLFLLIHTFSATNTIGQPVSELQAINVATGFLIERGIEYNPPAGHQHRIIQKSDIPVLHLFQFKNHLILVPADASAYPVLAYFGCNNFFQDNAPPAVGFWIEMYAAHVLDNIQNNKTPPEHFAGEWAHYNNGKSIAKNKLTAIDPMLNSTWNQGCYYNSALPAEPAGPCGHLFTGCVATALAQILKYFHYPKQGTGFHAINTPYGTVEADFENTVYGWADMKTNLVSENPAVADLMLHAVVAVNSQFFPYGTGAYDVDARHALVNYFGFHPGAQFRLRSNYPGDWNALIVSELEAGRPVIYGGVEQETGAGHTFIVDGFQEPGFFHINWGWGGQYNGYFYLDSLIAGNYHFDYFHDAITGIRPNLPTSQSLYPPENLGAQVIERTVLLSWSEPNVTGSLELIGYNIFRNDLLLNESILTGLQFTDEDVPPGDHTYAVRSVFIGYGNGPSAVTETYVSKLNETRLGTAMVFPNPTAGLIYIEFGNLVPDGLVVTLFDVTGRQVIASDFEHAGSNTLRFNLPDGLQGLYFITLTTGTDTQIHKIVSY